MQPAHSFNQKFVLSTIINLPLAPTISSFSKDRLQQKCFSKKFPKVKINYLAELPYILRSVFSSNSQTNEKLAYISTNSELP